MSIWKATAPRSRRRIHIALTGGEELEPTPADPRGGIHEARMDWLSNVVQEFNERYGANWTDSDLVQRFLFERAAQNVSQDEEYQNAKRHSDRQNARITHQRKVVDRFQAVIRTHTDLYRKFTDDADFKNWLCEALFAQDYDQSASGETTP